NPATRPIQLAQDLALAKLEDAYTPWPLRPVMTKEHPVNPDPLYARHHGYAFQGYAFDATDTPTFLYRLGDLAIEDTSRPAQEDPEGTLHRILRIEAPTPQILSMRVLTGNIIAASAFEFRIPQLTVRTKHPDTVLRSSLEKDGELELLIQLTLPAGTSTLEIDYVPEP
ncbi:MAG: hypothetical protein R3C42_09915, partial [Parvularculaceae bacterium]